jgi:hypothetical protein
MLWHAYACLMFPLRKKIPRGWEVGQKIRIGVEIAEQLVMFLKNGVPQNLPRQKHIFLRMCNHLQYFPRKKIVA